MITSNVAANDLALSNVVASIKLRGKRIIPMAPLHHSFEKMGWNEPDIVKLFYVVGLLLAMAAITYGVWL